MAAQYQISTERREELRKDVDELKKQLNKKVDELTEGLLKVGVDGCDDSGLSAAIKHANDIVYDIENDLHALVNRLEGQVAKTP